MLKKDYAEKVNFPQFWTDPEFFTLSKGLAVLTSMITPALLLSATGTYIISTSNRLGRCVDRIRRISELLEHEADPAMNLPLGGERKRMLLGQVEYLTRRTRILQDAMQSLYLAAASFVGTSVSIGIASVLVSRLSWVPITLGIGGACCLSYATFKLIFEARVAAQSVYEEIDFIQEIAKRHYEHS